jgi:hypothetical protein
MMVWRISAPHFVCDVTFIDGIVSAVAPILDYMRCWSEWRVLDYCWGNGWEIELL